VYGSEKEALLLASDLLVFPSYTEGQSVLLLEAIQYNIPVITTNVSDTVVLY
jgi:glycosyltransferase involved in cell wall biosynthesis